MKKKQSRDDAIRELLYDALSCRYFVVRNPQWALRAYEILERRCVPPCKCRWTGGDLKSGAWLAGIPFAGESDCPVHGVAGEARSA